MTIELIDNKQLTEIDLQANAVGQIVETAQMFVVETRQDAIKAIEIIAEAKSVYKAIEEKRKAIIAPARSFIAEWNDRFSPLTDALEAVEKTLKTKHDSWKRKEEQKLAEKKEELSLVAEALGSDVVPFVASNTTLKSRDALTYEKIEHKYSVEDLRQVPFEFLTIDEDRVKLALKGGVRTIPGLKIWEEKSTIVRRR